MFPRWRGFPLAGGHDAPHLAVSSSEILLRTKALLHPRNKIAEKISRCTIYILFYICTLRKSTRGNHMKKAIDTVVAILAVPAAAISILVFAILLVPPLMALARAYFNWWGL